MVLQQDEDAIVEARIVNFMWKELFLQFIFKIEINYIFLQKMVQSDFTFISFIMKKTHFFGFVELAWYYKNIMSN
jgi:hypothetical protein